MLLSVHLKQFFDAKVNIFQSRHLERKSYTAQGVWKVFKGLHFKHGTLQFYFALDPTNYVARQTKGNHFYAF